MNDRTTMGDIGFTESFGWGEDTSAPPGVNDGAPGMKRFWGKFRGVVKANIDPQLRGRLLVDVSGVPPGLSTWARPCLPYAGPQLGAYIVPPIGANVWVEFEQGHPDYPVWSGFWWGSQGETPITAQMLMKAVPQMQIESLAKHSFLVSDTGMPALLPKGGILLKSGACYIAISPEKIEIVAPTITFNKGMLEVGVPPSTP